MEYYKEVMTDDISRAEKQLVQRQGIQQKLTNHCMSKCTATQTDESSHAGKACLGRCHKRLSLSYEVYARYYK